MKGIILAQGVATVLVALAAVAQVIPATTASSSLTKEHQKKMAAWKETIRAGQTPNDHQWQVARVPSVDSTPVDETAVRNARRQACANQLNQIAVAKQTWALDKAKPEDAAPTVADLVSYLEGGQLRKCPDGGSYVIGKVNESPRCSVAGHELPKRPN